MIRIKENKSPLLLVTAIAVAIFVAALLLCLPPALSARADNVVVVQTSARNQEVNYTRIADDCPSVSGYGEYTWETNTLHDGSLVRYVFGIDFDALSEGKGAGTYFFVDGTRILNAGTYPLSIIETITEGYDVQLQPGASPTLTVKPLPLLRSGSYLTINTNWTNSALYFGQKLSDTVTSKQFTSQDADLNVQAGDTVSVVLQFNSVANGEGIVNRIGNHRFNKTEGDTYLICYGDGITENPNYTFDGDLRESSISNNAPLINIGKRPLLIVLNENSILTREYGTSISTFPVTAANFEIDTSRHTSIGTATFIETGVDSDGTDKALSFSDLFSSGTIPLLITITESPVSDDATIDASDKLYPISLDRDTSCYSSDFYTFTLKNSSSADDSYKLKVVQKKILIQEAQHTFPRTAEYSYGDSIPIQTKVGISVDGYNETLNVTYSLYSVTDDVVITNYTDLSPADYTIGISQETTNQYPNYDIALDFTPKFKITPQIISVSNITDFATVNGATQASTAAPFAFEAVNDSITVRYGQLNTVDVAGTKVALVDALVKGHHAELRLIDGDDHYITTDVADIVAGEYDFVIYSKDGNYSFEKESGITGLKVKIIPYNININRNLLLKLQVQDEQKQEAQLANYIPNDRYMWAYVIAKYQTKQMVDTRLVYTYEPLGIDVTIVFHHNDVDNSTPINTYMSVEMTGYSLYTDGNTEYDSDRFTVSQEARVYLAVISGDLYYDENIPSVSLEYGQTNETVYTAYYYSYAPESPSADANGNVKVALEDVAFDIYKNTDGDPLKIGAYSASQRYDVGTYRLLPSESVQKFEIRNAATYEITITQRPITVSVVGTLLKREGKTRLDGDISILTYSYLTSNGFVFDTQYSNEDADATEEPMPMPGLFSGDVLSGLLYSEGLLQDAPLGTKYNLVLDDTTPLGNDNYNITWDFTNAFIEIIPSLSLPTVTFGDSVYTNRVTFQIDSMLEASSIDYSSVTYTYNYIACRNGAQPRYTDGSTSGNVISSAATNVEVRSLEVGMPYRLWIVLIDEIENEIISGEASTQYLFYTAPTAPSPSVVAGVYETSISAIKLTIASCGLAENEYYYRYSASRETLAEANYHEYGNSSSLSLTGLVSSTNYFIQLAYKIDDAYITTDDSILAWATAINTRTVMNEVPFTKTCTTLSFSVSGISAPGNKRLVFSCQPSQVWNTSPNADSSFAGLAVGREYFICIGFDFGGGKIIYDVNTAIRMTTESTGVLANCIQKVTPVPTMNSIALSTTTAQGFDDSKHTVIYKLWEGTNDDGAVSVDWSESSFYTRLTPGTSYSYSVAVCFTADKNASASYYIFENKVTATLAKPECELNTDIRHSVTDDTSTMEITLNVAETLYTYWYTVKYAVVAEDGTVTYESVTGDTPRRYLTDGKNTVEGLSRDTDYIVVLYYSDGNPEEVKEEDLVLLSSSEQGETVKVSSPPIIPEVVINILKGVTFIGATIVMLIIMVCFIIGYKSAKKHIEKE